MQKTVRMVSTSPDCSQYGRRIPIGEQFDCDEDVSGWMEKMGRAKPVESKSQLYRTRDMAAEQLEGGRVETSNTLRLPRRGRKSTRSIQ